MGFDLSVIWFGIIIFATLMYIVMDGFDLGIGIIMPAIQDKRQRDTMVNSVAPFWDGNETWLVMGGAALLGAFPLAYTIILDALAIPLSIMVIALIFRGVAFEFRFKSLPSHVMFWDRAFIVGSIIATLCQGMVVGAVIDGFQVQDRRFSGGSMDWLTPFSLFCGVGLIAAYAFLGNTWLIMKTEGELQKRLYKMAPNVLFLLFVTVIIVSIWTAFGHELIAERWFSTPNIYYFLPVPFLTLLLFYLSKVAFTKQQSVRPFLYALGIVFLGFTGLGISIWPNIIPPSISIWEAAAPPQSQGFMLVGTLFIIPVILMYTFWNYYVFSGKVKESDSYH
ncbi:MAG: cytochrome d ubiquinol oxidase subunit II [Psychrobium sp.]